MTGPNSFKSESGTTLIEILVALAIFVIITSVATSVFLVSAAGSRKVIYDQNLQGSLTYSLESMNREIRMGQINSAFLEELKNQTGCDYQATAICTYEPSSLTINSPGGSRTKYALDPSSGQIKKREGSSTVDISSSDIDVKDLTFWIIAGKNIVPRVTIFVEAKPRVISKFTQGSNIKVQTTLSFRQYEN